MKTTSLIDETTCRELMRGQGYALNSAMSDSLKKLLLEMQEKCMKPSVIVDYVRYPFVEQSGNVRITFVEAIRFSGNIERFLDKQICTRPIMETGKSILEVKWDEFLPDYIKKHMQLDSLQRSSFSKYYLCKKYNIYGGIRV